MGSICFVFLGPDVGTCFADVVGGRVLDFEFDLWIVAEGSTVFESGLEVNKSRWGDWSEYVGC